MSLGLPTHLSRAANSRALATAARWAGFVCLGAAVVNVGMLGFRGDAPWAWATLVALVPMVGLLVLLSRGRTAGLTVAYLLVGTVCTFLYVSALLRGSPAYTDTNLLVVALPVVAMTLVGGTGTGALAGILWATLGFALAEAAVVLAAVTSGRLFRAEAISLGAYLLLVGVLAFDGLTRGSRGRPQSAIHRAVRDARLVDLRRELIAEATAELHDGVLSELATIAALGPGPLPPRLRERIADDLRGAASGRRGGGAPPAAAPEAGGGTSRGDGAARARASDPWFDSELLRSIELARDDGLTVDVSGDRDAIALLDEEARRAVGLAVRQCLVNVLRHSGSAVAEVALSASPEAVSVMVVDEGTGFAPSATGTDRLGLRQSVHERLERVGGRVTVYSSEDIGTTVIMVVPVGAGG